MVVEGGTAEVIESYFENMSIQEHLIHLIEGGLSKKEAVKQVADEENKKSDVYKESLSL